MAGVATKTKENHTCPSLIHHRERRIGKKERTRDAKRPAKKLKTTVSNTTRRIIHHGAKKMNSKTVSAIYPTNASRCMALIPGTFRYGGVLQSSGLGLTIKNQNPGRPRISLMSIYHQGKELADKHTKIPPAVIATGTKKHITSMQKFFILDDKGGIKIVHARFIMF